MIQGRVKFWNEDRRYGFVAADSSSASLIAPRPFVL